MQQAERRDTVTLMMSPQEECRHCQQVWSYINNVSALTFTYMFAPSPSSPLIHWKIERHAAAVRSLVVGQLDSPIASLISTSSQRKQGARLFCLLVVISLSLFPPPPFPSLPIYTPPSIPLSSTNPTVIPYPLSSLLAS